MSRPLTAAQAKIAPSRFVDEQLGHMLAAIAAKLVEMPRDGWGMLLGGR